MSPAFLLLAASLFSPPAHPSSDFDSLPPKAIARLGTLRFRDGADGRALWFTPDGKTLISATRHSVRTWNASTGIPRHTFPLHRVFAWTDNGVSLSADGTRLALPGDPKHLHRILDLPSGKVLREFGDPKDRYSDIACSPDGARLAVVRTPLSDQPQEERGLKYLDLWDAAAGTRERSWKTIMPADNAGRCNCRLHWATQKSLLLVTAGKAKVFDPDSGELRRDIDLDPTVASIALSADGATLATFAFHDWIPMSYIRLVDVATGADKQLIPLNDVLDRAFPRDRNLDLLRITFAPHGEKLIARDPYGTLSVIDLAAMKVSQPDILDEQSAEFTVGPDGSTLAVHHHGVIRLIDLVTGKDRSSDVGHHRPLIDAVFSADGRIAATACDRRIILWDVASAQEIRRLKDLPDFVCGMKISNDRRTLVSLGRDDADRIRTLQTWTLSTGEQLHRVDWNAGSTFAPHLLALSPDQATAAVSEWNDIFPTLPRSQENPRVLDLTTGRTVASFAVPPNQDEAWYSNVVCASYSADGRTLHAWSISYDYFQRWDLMMDRRSGLFKVSNQKFPVTPNPLTTTRYNRQIALALSPDQRHLLSIDAVGVTSIYEPISGTMLSTSQAFSEDGSLPVFSPDGRTIARLQFSSSSIHIIERASFTERQIIRMPLSGVKSIKFSPDGKRLITANDDSTALIWDLVGALSHPSGRTLSPKDLATHWTDLASNDGPRIQHAIDDLAACPNDVVPFLAARLHPTPVPDGKAIANFINELDSPDFNVREAASAGLADLEEAGLPYYRKALATTLPTETRRRLKFLADKASSLWNSPTPDRLRLLRSLEILELAATPDARRLLESLAKGDPSSWLTLEAAGSVERLRRRTP